MQTVIGFLGSVFGWALYICCSLVKNYGWAIILFTILAKLIMLPISVLVQKNSIKLVRMRPRLDELRLLHGADSDAYIDAQTALYKKERYSPMAGVWPLLLQIPIILGLINVMYNPLSNMLHLPADAIEALAQRAAELIGAQNMGAYPQLKIVELIGAPEYRAAFDGIAAAEAVKALDLNFFGINLALVPSLALTPPLAIPVLSGLSAWLLCYFQNRGNVLQMQQSRISQLGMTAFMIAISTYFAFIVPAAVGVYWIAGNLLAIALQFLLNRMYDPKKYIDYEYARRMSDAVEARRAEDKRARRLEKESCKRFRKSDNQESMRVLIYSERSGFYKYFSAMINALLRRSNLDIHYVTGDPNDAIFALSEKEPRIKPYYMGEKRLIPLMMMVESDIVVMTTPELENYYLKRSKVRKDVEYIYIDHGCTSLSLTYSPGALDHFDTIFLSAAFQIEELRALEKLRGTKRKKLVKCGYGLLDDMLEKYESMPPAEAGAKKNVLIAPSWQEDNIMDSCIDAVIEGLKDEGYHLTIRPHPQYVRLYPDRVEALLSRCRELISEDFVIETDFSSNETVYLADIIITDWSAIAYEYCYTTEKPALFINTKMKAFNPDYDKLGVPVFDLEYRSRFGRETEKADAADIARIVRETLEDAPLYADAIRKAKSELLYNLGYSGEIAAEYIISRLENAHPSEDIRAKR